MAAPKHFPSSYLTKSERFFMSYYVFSTLASDVSYDTYKKGNGDLPVKNASVTIKGGTGIADKRLMTPHGAIATAISEVELELLKLNPVFNAHVENGFISILKSEQNSEVVAANMVSRDVSHPLVDADFSADKAPTTKTKK